MEKEKLLEYALKMSWLTILREKELITPEEDRYIRQRYKQKYRMISPLLIDVGNS